VAYCNFVILGKKTNIYMKLIFGIGIIILLSCNNSERKKNGVDSKKIVQGNAESLEVFLSNFTLQEFPISVDQKLLDSFPYESVQLDTLLVSKFVEKDSVLVGDLTIYSSTKYYPLYKFRVGSLWAVITMFSSGSGGIEDKYHLIIYDPTGNIKSNLIIGKQVGSCESMASQIFSINRDYLISSENNYYNGNCETDEMKLIKTQVLKYQIDQSGNIR
jgi:hypothetical protein